MDALSIEVNLRRKDFDDGIRAIKKDISDLQGDINRTVASMRSVASATGGGRASRGGRSSEAEAGAALEKNIQILKERNRVVMEGIRGDRGYAETQVRLEAATKKIQSAYQGAKTAQQEYISDTVIANRVLGNGIKQREKLLGDHQRELLRGRKELARLQDQESNKRTGVSLGGFGIDRGQVQEARQKLRQFHAEQVATEKAHGKLLTDQAKEQSSQRLAVTNEFFEQAKRGVRKYNADAVAAERAYTKESKDLKSDFVSSIKEADREESLLAKNREAQRKKDLREQIADAERLKKSSIKTKDQDRSAIGAHLTDANNEKRKLIASNQREDLEQRNRDHRAAVEGERNKQNAIIHEAREGARKYHAEQTRLPPKLPSNPPDDGGGFFGRAGSFLGRFAAFTLAAGVLTRGFFALENTLQSIVSRGIEFNKSLENTKLAITAILVSSRQLVSSSGQAASIVSSYPVFLEKAKAFQKELLLLNITTLGTGEELTNVFQRVLAFSQDQVASDKERLLLATNILNAAKLLGFNGEQINTEARQILTLEQNHGQAILQSLGVTVQQLRVYKEQGVLVQKLNELLKAYSVIAADVGLTFEGLTSTVETFFLLLAGQSFESTFGGLKSILKGAGDELKKISDSGSALTSLGLSVKELEQLGRNLAQVTNTVVKAMAELVNATLRFATTHEGTWRAASAIILTTTNVLGGFAHIIDTLVSGVDKLANALSYLKPPAFLSDTKFARVATAFVTGGAVGALTGNPAIAATAAGASALKAALNFDAEQKAITDFAKGGQERLEALAQVMKELPQAMRNNPALFESYLKVMKDVSKELDALKAAAGSLPSPIKEEAIKKIQNLSGELAKLENSLERTRVGIKRLSEEEIKSLDKLRELAAEINQDFLNAQQESQIVSGALADLPAEQATLGVEAEKQKTNHVLDRLKAEREINKIINNPQVLEQLKIQDKLAADAELQTGQTSRSFFRLPPIPSKEDMEAFATSELELVQTGDQVKQSLIGQITATVQLNQEAEKTVGAISAGVDAYRDLGQEQVRLSESTSELSADYSKFLSKLSDTNALDLESDAFARAAEGRRRFGALVKQYPGLDKTDLGKQIEDSISKEQNLKYRQDIVKRIEDFSDGEERRVQIAIDASESILKIRQAENEGFRVLIESTKADLEDELSNVIGGAGISGRENVALEDRIRLMQAVANEEIKLIQLSAGGKQIEIDGLKEINSQLKQRIENLGRAKQEALNALGDNATPEERGAVISGGLTREQNELGNQLKENAANAKLLQTQVDASGNAVSRVVRKTNQEIADLSTTIVDLNNPIANAFGNLFDAFSKGGKGLKNVFKTLQKDISQSFSDAFRDSIKKKLQFDLEFKGNIFDLGGFFKDTFSNAVSFVGDLFGQAGGSGQGGFFSGLASLFGGGGAGGSGDGFLSNLFSMFGGGRSGPGNTSGVSNGGLFGGGSSNLGSLFGFGSGGGGGSTGGFGNVVGGSSSTVPGGGLFGNVTGGSSSTAPSGKMSSLSAGIAGYQGAEMFKGLLSMFGANIGQSKQGQLGGSIGGTVGGAIGSFAGPEGAAIGAALGNILGSVIGDLFAPGRIQKEKDKIKKFYEKALDLDFDNISEKKAAGGFEKFKGPTSAAEIALGSKFANETKGSNQGTIIRFAGIGLGNFKKMGLDAEEAQEEILDLADAMDFDIKSGIGALKANIGSGLISIKEFKEELKEAKKNLKEYGDTSNLTAQELSDLATANGNTGSRLITINEIIAGTIDIYAEFDEFIDGAAIANKYLADSFTETARATNFFNTDVESLADKINDGTLSLEEAAIELNKFRKEAGLAALDIEDFKISASGIQKIVDTIKAAVQTLRDAVKSGLTAGFTVKDFNRADIEKNIRKAVYQSMADAVAEGMIDGIIKASLAAGPISEAFTAISDLTSKFVAGDITESELFAGLDTAFTDAIPAVDRLATAVGLTSERFRQMLADAGILPYLLDDATASTAGLTEAVKNAIDAGVRSNSGVDIGVQFRRDIYNSIYESVLSGFTNGFIEAAAFSGPIGDAMKAIAELNQDFLDGTITQDQYLVGVRDKFTEIKPIIEAIGDATGIASDELQRMLADAGILPDLLGESVGVLADIKEAASGALKGGIRTIDFDKGAVEKNFRKSIYSTLVDAVADGFIDGIIKGTLASGPIEAAMENIRVLTAAFVSGDISEGDLFSRIGEEFEAIAPLIERIAIAVGLTTEKFRDILDAAGILPDILEDAKINAKDLAKELRQAAKDLLLDKDLSPLKPRQRVAEAQATFEELRARALAGDKEAAQQLPEAARQFLEDARKVFASSTQYEQIFDYVRGTLLDVADKFGPLEDTATKQLRTLEEIRAYLASVDINLAKLSGGEAAKPNNPNVPPGQGQGPGPSPGSNFGYSGPANTWPPPGQAPGPSPGSNFGYPGPANTWVPPGQMQGPPPGSNFGYAGPAGTWARPGQTLGPPPGSNFGMAGPANTWNAPQRGGRNNPETDGTSGDSLFYALNPDRRVEAGTTNNILQDTKDILERYLDELGLTTGEEERKTAESKVIDASQLLALQTSQEYLASIDKILKKMSGDREADANQQAALGSGRSGTPSNAQNTQGRSGNEVDSFQGDTLGHALGNTPGSVNVDNGGGGGSLSSVVGLLQSIDSTLKRPADLTSGGLTQQALSPIAALLGEIKDAARLIQSYSYLTAFNTGYLILIHNKMGPGTSLADGGFVTKTEMPALLHGPEVVIPLRQDKMKAFLGRTGILEDMMATMGVSPVSLREGGIVEGQGVPALLHGPEAVIPLPYGQRGGIEFSSPELVDEIRALREEVRSSRRDGNVTVNIPQSDVIISGVKMGQLVRQNVQADLNNQQIRVPQKAISKS